MTQSGRGTLRASLPRSAGRPSEGCERGLGGGGLPRARVPAHHTARGLAAGSLGAGTFPQCGDLAVAGPALRASTAAPRSWMTES